MPIMDRQNLNFDEMDRICCGGYSTGAPLAVTSDKPHHYTFTVYALDAAQLPVDAGASGAMVVETARNHLLAKGLLVVPHGR
jgi:phosphatidylethanolamine-binding protein (PEBP) family uncharacterized protein